MTNPLPESVLSGDPCEALTRKQITDALGPEATEGKREDQDQLGPRCAWSARDVNGGSFGVTFGTKTRQGLSGFYANSKQVMKVFRELPPISGFPAVAFKLDENDTGCTVGVGLANEYAVSISSSQSTEKQGKVDSCEAPATVMSWLVENLKQKAGG